MHIVVDNQLFLHYCVCGVLCWLCADICGAKRIQICWTLTWADICCFSPLLELRDGITCVFKFPSVYNNITSLISTPHKSDIRSVKFQHADAALQSNANNNGIVLRWCCLVKRHWVSGSGKHCTNQFGEHSAKPFFSRCNVKRL